MEDGKNEYVDIKNNVTNVNIEKAWSKWKEVTIQSGLHAY